MLRARIAVAVLAAAAVPACVVAQGPTLVTGEGSSGTAPAAVPPSPAPVDLSAAEPSFRRITPRGESPPGTDSGRSGLPSAGSALSALAVVVLLILAAARMWKTHGPKLPGAVPQEAAEVLGRCRIESRQSLYLVRLGSRVLVLGSSGGELTALSEITDPVEVDLIAAQCRSRGGGSSPFSRLFEARQRAEAPAESPSDVADAPRPEPRTTPAFRPSPEQRLADRLRGRRAGEEVGRAA